MEHDFLNKIIHSPLLSFCSNNPGNIISKMEIKIVTNPKILRIEKWGLKKKFEQCKDFGFLGEDKVFHLNEFLWF